MGEQGLRVADAAFCSLPGLVLVWVKRQWGIGIKLLLTVVAVASIIAGFKLQDDFAARATAPRVAAVTDGRLTRFGATESDWLANHQPNPYDASSWDLDPRLPGGQAARYTTVAVTDGRVTSLDLRLPDGTSADQAIAEVLTELPPDTIVLWRADGATCSSLSAESVTLRQLATSIAGGTGQVLITLSTRSVFNTAFDPMNVNHAKIVAASTPVPAPADGIPQCPE